ncbi:MAG: protein kinase domain-containing protein, partial [Gemmatimonadota bacterium]
MSDLSTRLTTALADRYRIERELGAGGMATVYLAQDLKHDRKVAVKVLRPELAAVIGAERFLSEIKTTANLQHPHILPLFDSGAADNFLFYVMPYVEGESLRDRLTREKQLPIADAVRIATEVAGALDYAHRHGVIHRDIKPENILLHDGRALVADFGIALAASKAGGTRMTETGMSLGTPTYMSPEQAMGEREITARSDVYALGCVTYEMLLGEPPFTGPTAQSIIAKVLTEKPGRLIPRRDRIPPEVEDAVLIALEKLPADRWGSAKEFADALAGTVVRRRAAPTAVAAAAPGLRRFMLPAAVGIAIVATASAVYFARQAGYRPATGVGAGVARYQISLPNLRAGQLRYTGQAFVLSPDGRRLAYVGSSATGGPQLWVRDRDNLAPRPLAGTDGADGLFFSPDGQWIGYSSQGRLFKVPASGGAPIALADSAAITVPGGAWLPNGQILFVGAGFGLMRVAASGGPSELLLSGTVNGNFFPTPLPRPDALLLTECTNNCAQMTLVAVNLKTRARDTLFANTARAWYLPTGHLVVARQDGSLYGARFDLTTLKTDGGAVPLLSGVQLEQGVVPELSIADDGTMLYLPADPRGGDVRVVRVDRQGRPVLLDPAWRANINTLALSADGRRLAVSIAAEGRTDLWVKQLDAGPLTRLTFSGTLNYRAAWEPGGRSLTYTSDQDGQSHLYRIRADGSGKPERIMPEDTAQIDESLWSPDGRWLVYRAGVVDGTRNIFARRVGTDTVRLTIAARVFDEYMPALSPDGRWIAYVSVESGHEEVYVRPFPDVERARWQVSTSGGAQPLWAHSGRELFYVTATDSLVAVDVRGTPDFATGARRGIFSTRSFLLQPFHQGLAVAPDDRAFIMLQRAVTTG